MIVDKKPIHVYRGKYIESTHDVHIAVVSASSNRLLAYYGDAHRLTFARSSMKPFQALPALLSGAVDAYGISEQEIALFCASHSGEPMHRETAASIVKKLGLKEADLQCGTHIPRDMDSYNRLIKAGGELTPYFSNCSGKHSGMLAGCLHQGFDLKTYRKTSHPYQQQIIDIIAEVTQYARENIALSVDGCGVPVHRVPLFHLALAFGRLAKPKTWPNAEEAQREALKKVRDSMIQHPEMVAGTGEFDTRLMEVFEGRLVAKTGAEGVHCFGDVETGIGVAVKIEDGASRARSVASLEVLKQLNIGDENHFKALQDFVEVPVLNAREETIGKIKPNFSLHHLFK